MIRTPLVIATALTIMAGWSSNSLADRDRGWDRDDRWDRGNRREWRGDWRRDQRHFRGRPTWRSHGYYGARRPLLPHYRYRNPWRHGGYWGYRDSWGWGSGWGSGYLGGLALGSAISFQRSLEPDRCADCVGSFSGYSDVRSSERISACYRIEYLPDGRERRVELPPSDCR